MPYVPNAFAFGTYGTPNTKKPHLSDVLNLIFFATCYSRVTNLPQYGRVWHMNLLFFYSSFSLISLSSSPSAIQYSPHGFLSTTDFLSTITDLYPSLVFFPLLFALFSLFYRRGSGCGSRLWL